AGKTRSVGAARLAWEASGVPVRGLAVSAVAAGVLSEEAGLASDTLAKFLCENAKVDPNPFWRLRRGEAVVLDEASMVASADLAALVAIVETAQAKLVLVGDHRQLGAVGAGGLFRLLVADTDAAELTDARRASSSPGRRRPRCAFARAMSPWSTSTSATGTWWAATRRRWWRPPSPPGSAPARPGSRWWCWPRTTSPSTPWPCGPGPCGWRPARWRPPA
ncbi:MAG: AAA family ATPase, partial [Acidimicrobiales bacterium]